MSIGSKVLDLINTKNRTLVEVQCWLGVVVLIIWAIVFIWIKKKERQAKLNVDYASKTAPDYSLYFANLPKNLSKEELEEQLLNYQNEYKSKSPG